MNQVAVRMHAVPNPYQAPSVEAVSDVSEGGETIAFEGYLRENDIRQLLHKPNLIWAMRALFPVVLVPTIAIPILVVFFGFPIDRSSVSGMLFLLMMTALVVGVEWYTSRSQQTKRLLQKYPDWCNQHLQGELSPRGLTLTVDRAPQKFLTSWPTYTRVFVNQHGIHLGFPDPDGAFFAIAAHMIEDFEPDSIRSRLRTFRRSHEPSEGVTLEPDWSGCPADAVKFVTNLNNEPAVEKDENPFQRNWSAHAWWLAQLFGVLMIVLHWLGWIELDAMGSFLLLMGLAATIWGARNWPRQNESGRWIWGWFTEDEMALRLVGQSAQVRWEQTESVELTDHHFTCVVNKHFRFDVVPEDLRSGSWSQLVDWEVDRRSGATNESSSTEEASNTQANPKVD